MSGAALVLGKIDSLEELWGSSALYVCPESEAELVRVATRLASDSMFRHSMAHRARMRARGYSAELMAHRYAAVYRGLLERPRRTAEPQGATTRVQAQA